MSPTPSAHETAAAPPATTPSRLLPGREQSVPTPRPHGDRYHDHQHHGRAPPLLTGRRNENFATVTVHPAGEDDGEDEYLITPLFVSIVPGIRLADHDGREP